MSSKRAIIFVLVFLARSTFAQISLDSSEFPIVGTNYLLNNVAFVDIPPSSASGPNETYDFTGGFTYGGSIIDYQDAAISPFTAQYPSATLSRYIPGDINNGVNDQHLYYATDASGFWQKGMVWIGYILDTITIDTLFFNWSSPNEDTLLTDQYTYGYKDSTYAVSVVSILFGGTTPVDFYNHLYKVIDVDGWGAMETGSGVYDGILRVHVTEYKYDSTFVFGIFDNAGADTIEYYLYYKEGIRYPLVKENTEPAMDTTGGDTTLYFLTEILNVPPDPPVVFGCTDTSAVNFNPMANQDDGSCVTCTPIAYTLTGDTSVCEGGSLNLNVSGGVSYVWSTGDSSSSINVSPTVTTTYSVLINNSQYCWEQATVQVAVHGDVVADFWNATPSEMDSTTFVNLSIDATDFIWDFGDGTSSTEASPTKYYDSLGQYTVMLIASNTCSVDTMITTVEVVIGIPENMGELSELKVVPNPTKGSASVYCSLNNSGTFDLSILDVLGRSQIIFSARNLPSGSYEFDISDQIEGSAPGVYFMRLQSSTEQSFFKWIKQ